MKEDQSFLGELVGFYSGHPLPFLLCDFHLTIIYCNKEGLLYFPLAKEGKSLFSLLGIEPVTVGRRPQRFRLPKGGEGIICPLAEPGGGLYYTVEIISPKQKEEDVFENERFIRFASHLAHEMGTPLSMLCTALSMLEKSLPKEPEGGPARYAKGAFKNYYQISRIASHYLSLSKIYSGGKESLKLRTVDLTEYIGEICKALYEVDNIFNVPLSFIGSADLCLCNIAPFLVERIMLNLLSNAFKYTKEGNRVTVSVKRRGGEAVIEVADLGRGMGEEALAAILSDNIPVDEYRMMGNGIGLKLVKFYTEMQGGRLEAESRAGYGSAFSVVLPLHSGDTMLKMPFFFDFPRFSSMCAEEFAGI